MSNLRKLIAIIDSLNESAVPPVITAKKPYATGSLLKSLNLITKSVTPVVELAREFRQFNESAGGKIHQLTGLPLNSDGTVTLYHHTSAANAAQIRKSGMIKSAAEPDVYMTTRKETDTGYGDTALPVRVDPRKLQIDDEFPDGRKDFRIDTGKPGGQIRVQVDTVSPTSESAQRYTTGKRVDLSLPDDGNKIREFKVDGATVVIDTNANNGKVKTSSIRVPRANRGNGSGRRAMQSLIAQADAEGVVLTLDASALDKQTSTAKLIEFYKSIGFELTGNKINSLGDPEMVRLPRKQGMTEGKKSDPCWADYTQVGTKKKNGKTVPNCVPKKKIKEQKKRVLQLIKEAELKAAKEPNGTNTNPVGQPDGAKEVVEAAGASQAVQEKVWQRMQNEKSRNQPTTESEGDATGVPHLTKEVLTHIVDQIGKEGAHAIIKSLEWGDGAAEELLQLIKQDLKKHISLKESVKQRLDKSCWSGYRKSGTKIKGGVKVNNCVKESKFGVYSIFKESTGPIKTFAIKEHAMAAAKYYNKNIPHAERLQYGNQYVVRNVYEDMQPAVATATTKMNPAGGAATAAPGSPAHAAPTMPGVKKPPVDPKIAQAKKAAIQTNLQKLAIPGANVAQVAASMEKADDMTMPLSATDNANNAKIATSLADVLQNPSGVQQLKTLTDKFKPKPGQ